MICWQDIKLDIENASTLILLTECGFTNLDSFDTNSINTPMFSWSAVRGRAYANMDTAYAFHHLWGHY